MSKQLFEVGSLADLRVVAAQEPYAWLSVTKGGEQYLVRISAMTWRNRQIVVVAAIVDGSGQQRGFVVDDEYLGRHDLWLRPADAGEYERYIFSFQNLQTREHFLNKTMPR